MTVSFGVYSVTLCVAVVFFPETSVAHESLKWKPKGLLRRLVSRALHDGITYVQPEH